MDKGSRYGFFFASLVIRGTSNERLGSLSLWLPTMEANKFYVGKGPSMARDFLWEGYFMDVISYPLSEGVHYCDRPSSSSRK
ncbi:hypothetical protein Syun_003463 [Stephania yunnanensis]|uniref:Uncharacterized protein n=1 Tax=Stephania yunnanensis TaxID=152371 RepID=A0AAP0L1C7_9MAGN